MTVQGETDPPAALATMTEKDQVMAVQEEQGLPATPVVDKARAEQVVDRSRTHPPVEMITAKNQATALMD